MISSSRRTAVPGSDMGGGIPHHRVKSGEDSLLALGGTVYSEAVTSRGIFPRARGLLGAAALIAAPVFAQEALAPVAAASATPPEASPDSAAAIPIPAMPAPMPAAPAPTAPATAPVAAA